MIYYYSLAALPVWLCMVCWLVSFSCCFFSFLFSLLCPSIINNDVRQSLCNLNVAHCAHKALLFNVHDFLKHQTLSGFVSKSSSKNQTDSNAFIQHLWFVRFSQQIPENFLLQNENWYYFIGKIQFKLKIFCYIYTPSKRETEPKTVVCA